MRSRLLRPSEHRAGQSGSKTMNAPLISQDRRPGHASSDRPSIGRVAVEAALSPLFGALQITHAHAYAHTLSVRIKCLSQASPLHGAPQHRAHIGVDRACPGLHFLPCEPNPEITNQQTRLATTRQLFPPLNVDAAVHASIVRVVIKQALLGHDFSPFVHAKYCTLQK